MPSDAPTRSQPKQGFTRVELVVVVAIVAILATVLAFQLPSIREQARIDRCISNLKGLGTACYLYDDGQSDAYPVPSFKPATEDGISQVIWAPGKIGFRRGQADDPKAGATTESDTEMSVTRGLWMLVRKGLRQSEDFICPSSQDRANNDLNPGNFWDFRSWNECSYGYQIPYGRKGRPRTDWDAYMVFLADKGPFGAALEAGMPNPGIPTPGVDSDETTWQAWNSPNHKGKGQVVLYADAHAEFKATPIVGVAQDNIYTRWSDGTGGAADINVRIHGTPPTGREAPFGQTDSLIYP